MATTLVDSHESQKLSSDRPDVVGQVRKKESVKHCEESSPQGNTDEWSPCVQETIQPATHENDRKAQETIQPATHENDHQTEQAVNLEDFSKHWSSTGWAANGTYKPKKKGCIPEKFFGSNLLCGCIGGILLNQSF
jgi:hypothetical protein